MNQQLEQTNRDLEQARVEALVGARAKSEFLANMSHEIRTPMNGVVGFANLLAMTPLSPDQQEFLSIIRSSSDALLEIIDAVLDLSKIDVGKIDLEAQSFDPRVCFEQAVDLVAPRAAEKGLELASVLDADLPPGVVGDVTRLRQIMVNLLSNAVKFTESGEVVLRVTVAGRQQQSVTLDCAVRDTGIGIPADRTDSLFDPFTQADSSTTRRYGGTGLGLTISSRLCELMGGRLHVDSQVGTGSTFAFTIAMPIAMDIAARPEDGRVPGLAGVKVLVVDDHAVSRHVLEKQLTRWGMVPAAVGSAAEAVAIAGEGDPFRVALVDMHLPRVDGVPLERALRERAGEDLGLIALGTIGSVQSGDGFDARIAKPVKRARLCEAILHVLSRTPGSGAPVPLSAPAPAAGVGPRPRLAVLIAEDNVVNSMLAVRLLQSLGITAGVARTGLEALDALAGQPYDAILMDVHMPVMDGLEATRRIADRYPAGGRPYVIALTASVMEADVRRCREAGMDDFLAKPISLDGLIAALDRAARARTSAP